ncbi:MAG: hypothetical protein ACLTZY_06820 [Alistipes indistinctus]
MRRLSEAVDDMARFQVGRQLSAQDRDDIVAFLGTLTGKFRGRELTNPNAGTVAGVVRSKTNSNKRQLCAVRLSPMDGRCCPGTSVPGETDTRNRY